MSPLSQLKVRQAAFEHSCCLMCGCELHPLAFITWPQLCCELSLKWQITFIWNSPWTTRRPWAVRRTRVPGLLAAHTYTPECCTPTSEIIRFPVPSTWIPSTPMGRPSTYEIKQERGFKGQGKKIQNIGQQKKKEGKRCAHVTYVLMLVGGMEGHEQRWM